MATVYVTLGYRADQGTPVMKGEVRTTETIASSAVSAQGTKTAITNEFWEIYCASDIWVKFGTDPTAAVGDSFFVPAGIPRNFQGAQGQKLAVIDG